MTISGGGGSDGKASDTERKENNSSCFLMLLELGTDHYFLRMVVGCGGGGVDRKSVV